MKVRYSDSEKRYLKLFLPLFCIRYMFHILEFLRYRRHISFLDEDLQNEVKQYAIDQYSKKLVFGKYIYKLCWAFAYDPFFLTLFYTRLKGGAQYLRIIKPDNSSLHIVNNDIGHNFIMHHPFSTIVNAKKVGDNFCIKNNVTIGNKGDDNTKVPVIGNNVQIGSNVVIFGNITIGDNVIIGAGAVVNKDIPNNCVVVGNPMRIIQR